MSCPCTKCVCNFLVLPACYDSECGILEANDFRGVLYPSLECCPRISIAPYQHHVPHPMLHNLLVSDIRCPLRKWRAHSHVSPTRNDLASDGLDLFLAFTGRMPPVECASHFNATPAQHTLLQSSAACFLVQSIGDKITKHLLRQIPSAELLKALDWWRASQVRAIVISTDNAKDRKEVD